MCKRVNNLTTVNDAFSPPFFQIEVLGFDHIFRETAINLFRGTSTILLLQMSEKLFGLLYFSFRLL